MANTKTLLDRDSILKQIGPGFTEAQALAIVELGPVAASFAILVMAKRIA